MRSLKSGNYSVITFPQQDAKNLAWINAFILKRLWRNAVPLGFIRATLPYFYIHWCSCKRGKLYSIKSFIVLEIAPLGPAEPQPFLQVSGAQVLHLKLYTCKVFVATSFTAVVLLYRRSLSASAPTPCQFHLHFVSSRLKKWVIWVFLCWPMKTSCSFVRVCCGPTALWLTSHGSRTYFLP